MRLVGAHHVGNALAAAAGEHGGARETGGGSHQAAPASRWRMEVTDRADGVTVVNDAHNANPDSMAAACAPTPQWAAAGDLDASGRCASWAPERAAHGASRAGEEAGRRRARHGRQPG